MKHVRYDGFREFDMILVYSGFAVLLYNVSLYSLHFVIQQAMPKYIARYMVRLDMVCGGSYAMVQCGMYSMA